MKNKIEYSMVVYKSKEKVKEIFDKHNVELVQGTFCGDAGFIFQVDDGDAHWALIGELEDLGTVSLSMKYGAMKAND